ncbi:hypothetical protein BK640_30545 [Pseudomonas protegens]|nr:hypothetical protein BK639_21225 [Pseudomonas protegens]ROL94681.1 hypothetical protein BK640_30545 [Pseudomonas protegens]ROM04000.1 hypothetical protein BK642_19990 [Pseudomonas protegens]ROM05826.1 hypothetical protein BK641_13660 [Pseudomonas protegens]
MERLTVSAGLLWSFLNPLLMLLVYTFVFSVVFKVRWDTGSDSKSQFALLVFTGMMVFNLFSECISRAPGLIPSNANYVKKVVFPLDLLPGVILGAVLFHTLVSFIVWLIFHLLVFGLPPFTTLLFPLVLLGRRPRYQPMAGPTGGCQHCGFSRTCVVREEPPGVCRCALIL